MIGMEMQVLNTNTRKTKTEEPFHLIQPYLLAPIK